MPYWDALETWAAWVGNGEMPTAENHNFPDDMDSDERARVLWADRLEYRGLLAAKPYYWAPEMCDVLKMAIPDVPEDQPIVEPVLFPSPCGFVYFAKPVFQDYNVLRWNTYHEHEGEIQVVADGPINQRCSVQFQVWKDERWRQGVHSQLGAVGFNWMGGAIPSSQYERYPSEQADFEDESEQEDFEDFLTAHFLILAQKIFRPQEVRAPRSTRKRVNETAVDPETVVRVIKLRGYEGVYRQAADNDDEVSREYTHRWLVRGHWRQQWYPSLKRNLPIYIHPHIKGPEGKPLATPHHLFAVIR